MPFAIDAYPDDLRIKCSELGLGIPKYAVMLPSNLYAAKKDSELEYESISKTLIKILAEKQIQIAYLGSENCEKLFVHKKSADIVIPAILITLHQIAQNPAVVAVMLNVLSNFVYDCLRGFPSNKRAKFEVIVEQEKNRSYKRLLYEGSRHDLKENAEEIKSIIRELEK